MVPTACVFGQRLEVISESLKMSRHDAIITGAALTPYNRRKDGTGFRDWSTDAFFDALAMAEIAVSDIDALFVASESDFFSMQLNPASILATELGMAGVSATRCEGGGASGQLAVHAAVNAVRSGSARHVAVIGVDPSASSLSGDAVRALYGFSFDVWTDGFTGATSSALYALSYQAFAQPYGTTDDDLTRITLQTRSHAQKNPGAHLPLDNTAQDIANSPMIASPYRRLHCSPLSDGAAALIISGQAYLPQTRRSAPRVGGIGAATDHMHLGARPAPGDFVAKSVSMQRACAQAGITSDAIGLAEIYDPYAGAALQGLVALGLSDDPARDLRSGVFGAMGRCPVNLSGGLMGQGAPVGATGVGQTATMAMLLEGRYHPDLQPHTLPRYGVSDTHGGLCTTAAVTILERGAGA